MFDDTEIDLLGSLRSPSLPLALQSGDIVSTICFFLKKRLKRLFRRLFGGFEDTTKTTI